MKKCLIFLIIISFLAACSPNLSDNRIISDSLGAMKDCMNSPPDKQNDCFMRVSEVLRMINPDTALTACKGIKDDNMKRGCFDDLYKAQNDTNVKLSLCKGVDIEDMKKGCLDELIPLIPDKKEALALCDEIKSDNNFKEHCLNEVGSENADTDTKLALCEARTGSSKDSCLQGVATPLFETDPAKAIEVCNEISDSSMKNNCVNYFTGQPELIKKNPTIAIQICDSFTLKDNCYMNVADKLSAVDPKLAVSVCKKLSDEGQIMNCFGMAWFSYNNNIVQNFDYSMDLCKSLVTRGDTCYRTVANAMKPVDMSKAKQACNVASSATTEGCLHEIEG